MKRTWITLGFVVGMSVVCPALKRAVAQVSTAAPDVPIVFTQIPAEAARTLVHESGMLRAAYGAGGRLVRLNPDGTLHVLTAEFDSACEPDVSFDGARILFAARRSATDAWNIWEMNADGSGARQITRDCGNCRTPAYQATLYTIGAHGSSVAGSDPWYQIMFVSDAAGAMNEIGSGPARSLYSCKLDGSSLRRLTMNLSDDLDPFLMNDGRVLLASWQRMDLQRGFLGRITLFGVHMDGADYALYAGDQGRRIKHMPCATSDSLVVFVEADRVGWDGAGQLASVTMRRSFASHHAITDDPAFLYHSPSPLPDGNVLVARRRADGSDTHGLCRLDPRTGSIEPVFDAPEHHDFHARRLAPRPQPDGRSSAVAGGQSDSGKLYCLDVYNTDPAIRERMRPGMVKRLRVIEGVPVPGGDAACYLSADQRSGIGGAGSTINGLVPVVQKRLLGEIPVEPDGSFQIEIPSDVPVQLQTLDENGMALRSCGWIWVKRNEPRGCIGCHEDPELVPENRLVQAIAKPGIPLILPPEKRRTVDFRRDVMPTIARRCSAADCHGGVATPVQLSADAAGPFNRAYVGLLAGAADPDGETRVVGKYIHPGRARTSPLIWRLFGADTSRPWDDTGPAAKALGRMPPHPIAEPLTEEEKRLFVEWIDLGAHWDGIPGSDDVNVASSAHDPDQEVK